MTEQDFPLRLRARQGAMYLGIGLSTFWKWSASGILPKGKRLTRRLTVWDKSDLDKFLQSKKEGGSHA